VQVVSAIAPSVIGVPVSPVDNGRVTAQSEFLTLLVNASLDFAHPHVESDYEEELEPPHNEGSVRDPQEQAPVLFIDPRLLAPQTVPVTLRFGFGPVLSVEPRSGSNLTDTEFAEPEAKPAATDKRDAVAPVFGLAVADFPAPTPASTRVDSSERTLNRDLLRDVVSSVSGSQQRDSSQETNTAFALRLSHSFDQDAEVRTAQIPASDTKQNESPAIGVRSATIPKGSNLKPSSSSLLPSLADSTSAIPVTPAGTNNEQHEEPDHRRHNDSPNSAPSGPLSGEPSNPVFERPTPVSMTPSSALSERQPQVAGQPSVHRASVPEPAADTKAAPLREITLKVGGDSDRSVDLHIVNERGKLHVEVRTSDSQLAASLRDNVGDLVQKLDRSGFRAEPASIHESSPISSGSSQRGDLGNESGHNPGRGEQQSGSQGGDSQPGQHQQQGQGRGNRPRWLEEIVKNFQSSEQEKENEK
jgi:hypothetical protein